MDPELAFSTDKQQENQQLLVKQKQNDNTGKIEKHSLKTSKLRFVFLVFGVLVLFGNYYCYDSVQALWTNLNGLNQGNHTGLSDSQVTTLYSVYSYPNIAIPWVSGIIIDKVGPRIILFVTTILLIIGQIVFMIGCIINQYPVMIVGRVIYGLGGESQFIAQSTIVSSWFHGKELAMALGGSTAAGRLGSTLNTLLTPKIYTWCSQPNTTTVNVNGKIIAETHPKNLLIPLLVGAIIIAITLTFVFIVNYMDKKADQQEGITFEQKQAESAHGKIRILDILKMKPAYYMVVLNCFFGYGAFFTMNGVFNQMLSQMFNLSTSSAGNAIMVVYVIAACFAPPTGRLLDKFGKRAIFVFISMVIFLGAVIILVTLPENYKEQNSSKAFGLTIIPLVIFSIFYCLYSSALWPCIPLSCKPEMFGAAFGLVDSAQQLAVAVMMQIWGVIQDNTTGFRICLYYIIGLIGCALVPAVILNVLDFRGDKILNKPSRHDVKVSEAKRSFHG